MNKTHTKEKCKDTTEGRMMMKLKIKYTCVRTGFCSFRVPFEGLQRKGQATTFTFPNIEF